MGGVIGGAEYTASIPGFCGFGMSFRLDGFRVLYALIGGVMWLMTGMLSKQYFAHHYHNRNRYYFFTLMTLGATAGVFLSDDLYTTFIFFEVMSFTSYTWVAHEENPGAMKAAETYLAIAVIGGMVTLMGLFMVHHLIGSLSFEALHHAGEHMDPSQLYLPGILVMFGFAAKAGAFPVHIWLPKAHPVAPAPASALLSGALTKVGIYGIVVLTTSLFHGDEAWGNMLLVLAVATMFGGALLAVFAVDLKRILASSSMSQIGFVLIGVALSAALGEEGSIAAAGAIYHMMNHSILKLGLFMGAGAVYMNLHALDLNKLRGFGRKKPVLAVLFAFGGLGLGGIPLWNGYLSKTLLHEAILEYAHHTGSMWISGVEWIFMLTGGMTLAYMTKIFVALFLDKPGEESLKSKKGSYATLLSRVVLALSALLILVMGIPGVMARFVEPALFFAGGSHLHIPHFFAWEALKGAVITLCVASVVYFGLIRGLLMKNGRYLDRWPARLDLENTLYRPILLGFLPGLFGGVAKLLSALPDLVFRALPWVFGAIFRFLCDLPDRILLVLRKTVLREVKPKVAIHKGSLVSETLGHVANRLTHTNRFVVYYGSVEKWMRENVSEIGSGFSFALLLTCLGLCVTLIGLLLF
ncbi:MAG: sodium:proton antiporter [Ruminococcaceae bacterium]|nr:sodium:proton antiporter [Oscillospiraceae bacterium]